MDAERDALSSTGAKAAVKDDEDPSIDSSLPSYFGVGSTFETKASNFLVLISELEYETGMEGSDVQMFLLTSHPSSMYASLNKPTEIQ